MKIRWDRFEDKLRVLVWASWLLILTPLLTEYIEQGCFPRAQREWVTEAIVGTLILGYALFLRRTLQEIIKLNDLRRSLADSIVHDLKNPMTTILGTISALRDNDLDAPVRRELLDMALRSSRYQVKLIETILDVDRIEDARLPVSRRAMGMEAFALECIAAIREVAVTGEVALETACPAPDANLYADPELLKRVVLNLVWNALKYTPKGGRITVSCRPEGPDCLLEVSDTGIGIQPEHLGRLFQKYYRVEGDTYAAVRGTGLGLYFSRLVAEAHGGGISASSDVGRGTTVTVRIPGAAVLPSPGPAGPSGRPKGPGAAVLPSPGPAGPSGRPKGPGAAVLPSPGPAGPSGRPEGPGAVRGESHVQG